MASESGTNESGFITELKDIQTGLTLEAKDKFGNWLARGRSNRVYTYIYRFLANIVEINPDTRQALVHFKGWGSRFDEWVELSDNRLRKASDDYPRYRGRIPRKVRVIL